MPDPNDHDLLIEIKTIVKTQGEKAAADQAFVLHELRGLNLRVSELEKKDKGDSATVRAITKDVQESLHNSKRITDAFVQIEGLKGLIADLLDFKEKLEARSWQIWSALLLAIIAGVWGLIAR